MVAELSRSQMDAFVLTDISLVCSDCSSVFATTALTDLPDLTEYDTIEADLHRVFPSMEVRSALIAVCPYCNFAGWSARFRASAINPELLPQSDLSYAKKFALAVKHAREREISSLNVAHLAVNGLYCAREAGDNADAWLELCAYEQSKGLAEESDAAVTAHDYLLMAELYRQLGSFDLALQSYAFAATYHDAEVTPELLEHQVVLARSASVAPTVLPPYLVRQIYPGSVVESSSLSVNKKPLAAARVVHNTSNKLSELGIGPPRRRAALSAAIPQEPVSSDEFVSVEFDQSGNVESVVGVYDNQATDGAEAVAGGLDGALVGENVAADAAAAVAAGLDPGVGATETAAFGQIPAAGEPPSAGDPMRSNVPAPNTVPLAKVRDIIATPQGGSVIYLVQAAPVQSALAAQQVTQSAPAQPAVQQLPTQPLAQPLPAQPVAASMPAAPAQPTPSNEVSPAPTKTRGSKSKKKATPAAPVENPLPPLEPPVEEYFKGAAAPSDAAVAEAATAKALKKKKSIEPVAVFPEIQLTDDYADDDDDEDYSDEEQAPTPTEQQQKDFSDAVAQVESFLNLTRQSSYQNWIRNRR